MKFMSICAVVGLLAWQGMAEAKEPFAPIFYQGHVVYVPGLLPGSARIFRIVDNGGEGSRSMFDQDYRAYDHVRDFRGAVALDEVAADLYVVDFIKVRSDLQGLNVRRITKNLVNPDSGKVMGYEIDGKFVLAGDVAANASRVLVAPKDLPGLIDRPSVTHFSDGTLVGLLKDQSAQSQTNLRGILKAMNRGAYPPPANFLRFQAALKNQGWPEDLLRGLAYRAEVERAVTPRAVTDGTGLDAGIFHPVFNVGRVVYVPGLLSKKIFRIYAIGGEGSRSVFDENFRAYDFQSDFRGAIALNEIPVDMYLLVDRKIRSDLTGTDIKRITKMFVNADSKQTIGYEMDGEYVLAKTVAKSGQLITSAQLPAPLKRQPRIAHFTDAALLSLLADGTAQGQQDKQQILKVMRPSQSNTPASFLQFATTRGQTCGENL